MGKRLRASHLLRIPVLMVCVGLLVLVLKHSDSTILFWLSISVTIDAVGWLFGFHWGLWVLLIDGAVSEFAEDESIWVVEDRRRW